jgi:hypothetical protein
MYITNHEENGWLCLCGNTPTSDGFYPCTPEGAECEPTPEWAGYYWCARCDGVIDSHTLTLTMKGA